MSIRHWLGWACALAGIAPAYAGPCDLIVEIHGIRLETGDVRIALFDNASDFLKKARRATAVAATAPVTRVCFADLPAGEYAVAAYHDINGNGRNDPNLFRIPSEPSAFSRGARARLGPPSWNATRVMIVPQTTLRMDVR